MLYCVQLAADEAGYQHVALFAPSSTSCRVRVPDKILERAGKLLVVPRKGSLWSPVHLTDGKFNHSFLGCYAESSHLGVKKNTNGAKCSSVHGTNTEEDIEEEKNEQIRSDR